MKHATNLDSLPLFGQIKIWIIRFTLIVLWVLLIFGILYLPKLATLSGGVEGSSSGEKRINLFAWGDSIDPSVLAEFEKQTGIKVYLNYYSSNEELQFKLSATGGEDCDLVMPSDYAVAQLVKEGLLKPLDHARLTMWRDLNPLLLNHSFDPNNLYSIPFVWDIYGLGINTHLFSSSIEPNWGLIFDPQKMRTPIVFNNDPIEAVLFSAFYLFGRSQDFSEEEFTQIRSLLLKQRKWVEAYTDFRGDYFLATGNCSVCLAISSYIKRAHKQFPFIVFKIPAEGSFLTIENFCIPKKSSREKYVYQLLNFLYSKESISTHYQTYGLIPSTLSALTDLELTEKEQELLTLSRDDFQKLHFFKNVFPQQKVRNLWVEVKSF